MKTVHLIGVGGIGMTSLAGLFTEKGWHVRGSDEKIYPPASTELERLGVELRNGFRAENLNPSPDLVIVGNVVSRGNPEVEALLSSSLDYTSMAQALTEHFLLEQRRVVVCGTHGKTTTTSLLAWILRHAGMKPGFFVGGIPVNFGRGYQATTPGHPFVIEGDEYDTAFFEKTPKFLHYKPQDVVLTGIEFDHADIYADLEAVRREFEKLMTKSPSDGILVACGDSRLVREVSEGFSGRTVVTYGRHSNAQWQLRAFESSETGSRFQIFKEGRKHVEVASPLLGSHNALNTIACFAMAEHLGVSAERAQSALACFSGIRRRQEFLGEVAGVRLYDDFAHHPTAIMDTLAAFVPMAQKRKGHLWAVFEPRSNTVRRRIFQEELPNAFRLADETVFAPVFTKRDALGEKDLLKPEEVRAALIGQGRNAFLAKNYDEIVEKVARDVQSGDVVVFMSNGGFGQVPSRVLGVLKRKFS